MKHQKMKKSRGAINIFGEGYITFDPSKHTYTGKDGNDFLSVTRLIGCVKQPFDRDGISMAMARNMSKELGIPVKEAQGKILAEWDDKLKSSEDHGNFVHNNLENFHRGMSYDRKIQPVINALKVLWNNYYRTFPEQVVYDRESLVAGMVDLPIQRRKTSNVIDFFDYKTYESKGMQFDSVGRKNDKWKHYDRFLLPPLDHIEDCNYNHASLQLSLYARISEKHGIQPGRLGIIFIDTDLSVYLYPVPYMKMEADILLKHAKQIKKLPEPDQSYNFIW
jgi:hypothetical protein